MRDRVAVQTFRHRLLDVTDPNRHNLELKARHADLHAARKAVTAIAGIRSGGVEIQVDTYFQVPGGRLKLREINDESATLIFYERPDRAAARICNYQLVPVLDAEALKTALATALGIRGVVRKRREIYFWHNVRIHLDEVAGLGTLVELEAVLAPEDDEKLSQERLEELCELMGIADKNLLGQSNADLLGM
jgi:predicted adenylyl cyclase CyaB